MKFKNSKMIQKEFEKREIKFLSPTRETLKVNGRLFYNEGSRSWSIIRLKKEILHEFPQLKEKRSKFGYMIAIYRSFDDLKKNIMEFEKKEKIVPMLLTFRREEE